MNTRILFDFLLRISALGGKFLLVLCIAKVYSSEDVGFYGIYTSLIAISLYFVGMDFYTYSTREILNASNEKSLWNIIFNQLVFFLFTYIILLVIWQKLAEFTGVNKFVFLALALLISEHLSQEVYRILIALKSITMANALLFIRSGAWCYLCVFLIFYDKPLLGKIFETWLLFSAISFLIGVFVLLSLYRMKVSDIYLDWKWIYKGIKVCGFFFIGTLFLRGINYFDKVIAQQLINMSMLGVYVFYFGIAAAVQSAIDVLIMTRYFPRLVEVIQKHDYINANKSFFEFRKKTIIYSLALYLISFPFCYFVVVFTGKSEYLQGFSWYIAISLSNIILNVSMPYYYYLYGGLKDRVIVVINLLTFSVFMLVALFGLWQSPFIGIWNILIAYLLANIFTLLTKIHYKGKIDGSTCNYK